MTLFEWYDQGHARLAMEVGKISPSEFQEFIIFKRFLDVFPTVKNQTEAIRVLSDEFKTSESSIFRTVSLFRKGS